MPKESRRSGSRGSSRRSSDVSDDGKKSSSRETPKIAGSVNRFSPFQREIPRRESKSEEEETFTTLARTTTTSNSSVKSSGIIENGMKYIMFPLHLLRFCIFGTSTLSIDDDKSNHQKRIEPSEEKKNKEGERKAEDGTKEDAVVGSREKKNKIENEDGKRASGVESKKKILKDKAEPCKSKNHSDDERVSRDRSDSIDRGDKVGDRDKRERRSRSVESRKSSRRADEDSDSASSDKWSTAESSMDVSIEYESGHETTPYRLEEPMDISIEESIDENSPGYSRNASHRPGTCRARTDPSSSSSSSSTASWSSGVEESSSSSVEEEIVRVFRKKCTSSSDDDDDGDDSTPRPPSPSSGKRNEADRGNREERKNVILRESILHPKIKSDKERVKPSTRKKEESVRETVEKRTTSTTTSGGYNSSSRRVSKTPVKSKDTKKRYKEKGVQTDSAFSDDDVEMIPLDARLTEKRASNRSYRRKPHSSAYQMEEMDQDIFYIADNEDSNDGYGKYSRNRISSISGSSSSTDLGFEDQRCLTPNCCLHTTKRERVKSPLHDNITIKEDRLKRAPLPRAPPGFPKVPQNPPIPLKIWSDYDSLGFPFLAETKPSVLQYGQNYPPAPTPMRHLYHEYPEFMPFPEEVESVKIFKTMLANDYLS
ncbi:hypothetical protein KPH14_002871 [Odynerus spinipes]|uniref:Uncharacterized protein n=1 Tax=Odynerus spinipes TaxID=1348599 RepID=A0AAD9VV41_9HYME|nr:hypothetical protein KPH14_002871 [Odynerus spinipes]